MKLLLLDDDFVTIEQLKILTDFEKSLELIDTKTIDYREIDMVIIDPFNEKYSKTLKNILAINPQIRTIALTDTLNKAISKGCDYCHSNYNRIRLIKPIKLKTLLDTIKNFDKINTCPLMDAFYNIEKLVPIIINQFNNLFYDKEKKIVSSNNCIESKEHTMEIVGLLTLFDQNKIDYTILDSSSVKVHI